MENLIKFKEAILQKRESKQELENCYLDFLNDFNITNATIFTNLLNMCEITERIEEIYKVLDLVRFPVKKSIN